MNKGNLMQALPIVAAAYGRKFGVKVQVGGTRACTDGNTINIPEIREDPVAKTLAWGYLTHEAAHVRFTDMEAYRATAIKSPLVKTVLNILEDVRIENAILGPYPGSVRTLDETLGWLVHEGKTMAAKEGDSPPRVLSAFLLTLLRYRVRRQAVFKELAETSERVLRETFPASFVHRLLGLLAEVPGLDGTASTADLAERIVALVRKEAQEPLPTPKSDVAVENRGTGGDAQGRNALQAVLSAGEDDLPEDLFAAVAEALNAQTAGTSTPLLPSLENYEGDRALGHTRLAGVKGESAKLAARLQGLVQAHDMAKTRTTRRGRALSTGHLHRAAVGDDRVFQRTDRRMSPNTAIHVLIDLSSSMNGGSDRIALDAAMSLALALEPIRGVSCAATAFPSLYGPAGMVTRIKSHGDRVAARAGAFVQKARGSTPMTGALWYAAADLLARQEERRVILILTDGAPNDWDSASEMVVRAGAAGIETIGIGIATDVGDLFPVAVSIASVADLKGELFRIAEQLLLK